jgi:Short repeat of unknown function (DUF308)
VFAGVLLMAVGAFASAAPVAAGEWSLAILGIPLIVLSVAEAYSAFTSPRRANATNEATNCDRILPSAPSRPAWLTGWKLQNKLAVWLPGNAHFRARGISWGRRSGGR